ncbi:metallophosphoesterase [Deltaproteobacteria bacterium]|nr:metallophosphoesterase [Deltaproteobacteria bacterium]
MNNISRRKFIKKTMIIGAAATAFPTSLFTGGSTSFSAEIASPVLSYPPYLGKPTYSTITVNLVAGEKPIDCFLEFRRKTETNDKSWFQTKIFSINADTPADILLEPLIPGTIYEYQVHARLKGAGDFETLTANTFMTQRKDSSPFSFAMISDSHIAPNYQDRLEILSDISASILARKPDFMLMLGDNIQTFTSHGGPMTEERFGPMLYSLLRQGLGDLPASAPVFKVIGNWEGENGWHPDRERGWARKARMAWIPNPGPDTYPEGGNEHEDYYGFAWGDLLCLVITVTGYTLSDHVYQGAIGTGDDWSLGKEQRDWLYDQLSKSNAKWKLLFIHHTVGGNAGGDTDTRYGRGGGQAAGTGEQKLIHQWMRKFGVKALFYGHDHVFTDIPVDGIHYVCVGSAGAPWKFPKENTGYERYWTESGYTWVDVHKDKLTVSFVKPDALNPEGELLYNLDIV